MCHSFTICSYQELERALREMSEDADAALPKDMHAGGIAYPGTFAPVMLAISEHEALQGCDADAMGSGPDGRLFPISMLELGFGWPVEWKKGTVFNARLESLLSDSGMWAGALSERRCIVPCESFFESHMEETSISPRTGKPVKRRYSFASPDGGPLFLGAVYEGDFFSIVTTAPNADVAPVHDRMPLVLSVEEARLWIDPSTPMADISRLGDRSGIELKVLPEGKAVPADGAPEQLPLL